MTIDGPLEAEANPLLSDKDYASTLETLEAGRSRFPEN